MVLSDPRSVVLDSATLYSLLHALSYDDCEEWPLWTLQCGYNATVLALTCQWLQRVETWCTNVKKVRENLIAGYIDLSDVDSVTIRANKVWSIVRQLELEVHQAQTERNMRGMTSILTSALGIGLGLWAGGVVVSSVIAAIGGALAFTKAPDLPATVAQKVARREGNIERLYELGGGRLIQLND